MTAAPRPASDPAAAVASVAVPLLRLDQELPVPTYAHLGDAGADLYSAIDFELAPGQRALIPTGVAIALPAGFAGFIHPRSGLSVRHGIGMVNAPGTVDAGYRGEIKVNLINHDRVASVAISRGDRIAQLVVQQVWMAKFMPVDDLPASSRGEGGFGSTG